MGLLPFPGRPNNTRGSSNSAPAAATHSNCFVWGLGLGVCGPKPSPCLECLLACGLLSITAFKVSEGSLALCGIVGECMCCLLGCDRLGALPGLCLASGLAQCYCMAARKPKGKIKWLVFCLVRLPTWLAVVARNLRDIPNSYHTQGLGFIVAMMPYDGAWHFFQHSVCQPARICEPHVITRTEGPQ